MKKLLLIALLALNFSCSKNNCTGNKSEINTYYDNEIKKVNSVADPIYGPDYRKIKALNEERNAKLANACG